MNLTPRSFLAVLIITLSCVCGSTYAESVPKLINYQGKLTDASGENHLANGEYSVKFELYDGPTDGTLVWGETRTITLVGGLFNVALGGAGSQPLAGAAVNDIGFAFGDAERYLQTTIVSGPGGAIGQTLLPRQQMASVPFAMESNRAKSVAESSITRDSLHPLERIPAGTVQMFHSFGGTLSLPRGWMILNGNVVNQANYNAIHGEGAYAEDGVANSSLSSKNLPNMNARYPTGVNATTQNGSSAITAVGNPGNQAPLADHTHNIPFNFGSDSASGSGTIYISGSQAGPQPTTVGTFPRWLAFQVSGISSYEGPGAWARAKDGVNYSITNGQSSVSQNIRPDSIQFIFIIKVL